MHQVKVRLIIEHNGTILLVRRKDSSHLPGLFELPGGEVSENESLDIALQRQLKEEISISFGDYSLYHAFSYRHDNSDIVAIVYFINIKEEFKPSLSSEHDNYVWQNIKKLDSISKTQELEFVIRTFEDTKDVTTTTSITEVKLYTDGGSRGNPGPSALGYVIYDAEEKVVKKDSKYLGVTTNNQAEYQAVREGLMQCAILGAQKVSVFLDSQLVANQMNGIYKIKNRDLWPIHQAIKDISKDFSGGVSFTYVPRALNTEADAMVNFALDENEKLSKK